MRLAEAISDGAPIEWEKEFAKGGSLHSMFDNLRALEQIARMQQTSTHAEGARELGEAQEGVPTAWGPLRIVERIGHGNHGDVYRAYDPSLRRDVALKLLRMTGEEGSELQEERFLDEARRLARMRHPNVLAVHGAARHDGRVGLWTDEVRGKTLEECLAEQGPFSAQEAVPIGLDLCRATAAVHAAGLFHRDIKTANIMREHGGRIVLMDFGSGAERIEEGGSSGSPIVSGTPLFMAPELFAGAPPSTASDVYSLGVVLYRLVSGRFPVEALALDELKEKHAQGVRTPLRTLRPDLPTTFVRTVESALAPAREGRYQTSAELERALVECIAPAPVPDAVRLLRPPIHSGRRGWMILAASGLAVLAGFAMHSALKPSNLQVEASLYRLGDGTEERLLPGARVRPGDRLFLELGSSRAVFVYVLNEDEKGSLFLLHPPDLAAGEPLGSGERHRLPGERAGREMTWQVTSAGGREKFWVIAAIRRPEALERELATFVPAIEGREVVLDESADETLEMRGIGGLSTGEQGNVGSRLAAILRRAGLDTQGGSEFRVWQIELDNPPEGSAPGER